MKNFIRLIFTIIITSALFTACKKTTYNAPEPTVTAAGNYFMKYTLNGSVVTYNTCVVSVATTDSVTQILINGLNISNTTVGDNSFEVDIIQDPSKLKTGSSFSISSSFEQPASATLTSFPDTTNTYISQPAKPIGNVLITDITSTYIKGTFSGTLFAADDFTATTPKAVITDGSFYAKR